MDTCFAVMLIECVSGFGTECFLDVLCGKNPYLYPQNSVAFPFCAVGISSLSPRHVHANLPSTTNDIL
jgi:hypothetical protein